MNRNEAAAIQVIGIVIMVIIIAAFASVISFGFEPSQAAPAVMFAKDDIDPANELLLVTSSEPLYWADLTFLVEPADLTIEDLPSGPALVGQTIDCPNWRCTVTIVYKPSNAIVGVYEFDGPIYVADSSDGQDESEGPIPATILKITPSTLNLNSLGNTVTCHIKFPDGYNVGDIDISTILLNDVVPAKENINIGDYDNDGRSDIVIQFDRQSVITILSPGDNVEIKITGLFNDGKQWVGMDYITVI